MPDDPVTRWQAVDLLVRALEVELTRDSFVGVFWSEEAGAVAITGGKPAWLVVEALCLESGLDDYFNDDDGSRCESAINSLAGVPGTEIGFSSAEYAAHAEMLCEFFEKAIDFEPHRPDGCPSTETSRISRRP